MISDVNYFTKKTLLFISPVLLSILLSTIYFTFFSHNNFKYEFLFLHQDKKVRESSDIHTVFVGDSSLGNAIDANYFTELSSNKTLNLALTGKFGYAGSYNMLKRVYRRNPNIKTVHVMQTIDMYLRPISYTGYILTAEKWDDIMELKFTEIFQLIKASLILSKNVKHKIREWLRNSNTKQNMDKEKLITNDYIQQGNPINFSEDSDFLEIKKTSKDRFLFLKKIKDFTKKNNIKLTYIHGPYLQERINKSKEYINFINKKIKKLQIPLINKVIGIPDGENGDSEDHISPFQKKEYTKKYWKLIKEYQTKPL